MSPAILPLSDVSDFAVERTAAATTKTAIVAIVFNFIICVVNL